MITGPTWLNNQQPTAQSARPSEAEQLRRRVAQDDALLARFGDASPCAQAA